MNKTSYCFGLFFVVGALLLSGCGSPDSGMGLENNNSIKDAAVCNTVISWYAIYTKYIGSDGIKRVVEVDPSTNYSNASNVRMMAYNGTNKQLWYFCPDGKGYYRIVSKADPNKVLEANVRTKPLGDGTNVHIWQYESTSDYQLWSMDLKASVLIIRSKVNPNLVLDGDVGNAPITDYTNVQLWSYCPNPGCPIINQNWYYTTNGSYNCNDIKLSVEEVHFNWNWNSYSKDAINTRENYETIIRVPEFKRNQTSFSATYIRNTFPTIKVKFSVTPPVPSLSISGFSSETTEGCLGNTSAAIVDFVNGVSGLTTYYLPQTPSKILASQDIISWYANGVKLCETSHTIYNILDVPGVPWTQYGDSKHYPWAEVLKSACAWTSGVTDKSTICKAITQKAYEGNFGTVKKSYHGTNKTEGTKCYLSRILNEQSVDCKDMSAVVQLFSHIVGGDNVFLRRIPNWFYYKPVLPIGWSTDRWTRESGEMFDMHQFAWYGDKVYDACLQLNKDNPRIPVGEDVEGNYKTDLKMGNDGYWNWRDFTPIQISVLE